MKYFYRNARLPVDSPIQEINAAAARLHDKLASVDLDRLEISDYNKKYLGKKRANAVGTLQLCTYILVLALAGRHTRLSDFTFVDYGGGSGVLSLLAKEMGVGRVIYNDIYDVSRDDVMTLSKALGIAVDDFVCGDIDDLLGYVHDNQIVVDAVGSYAVIEHIYDFESYLRKMRLLAHPRFRLVMGSGANMRNPLVARQMRKIHLRCEYQDREKGWGAKERDSVRGYLSLRKEIIGEYDPRLSDIDVQRVAEMTRGLMLRQIETCVDEYQTTGVISYKLDHATNTCDPNAGNWAEHL